jgi:acetoin utilization deacetylase AcuC-like enzyme
VLFKVVDTDLVNFLCYDDDDFVVTVSVHCDNDFFFLTAPFVLHCHG